MVTESFSPIVTTIGGGFLTGILIGWALKKVIKLFIIIAGLFLAGLAFLQHSITVKIFYCKYARIYI